MFESLVQLQPMHDERRYFPCNNFILSIRNFINRRKTLIYSECKFEIFLQIHKLLISHEIEFHNFYITISASTKRVGRFSFQFLVNTEVTIDMSAWFNFARHCRMQTTNAT